MCHSLRNEYIWELQCADNTWRKIIEFDQTLIERIFQKRIEAFTISDAYIDFCKMTMIRKNKTIVNIRRRDLQNNSIALPNPLPSFTNVTILLPQSQTPPPQSMAQSDVILLPPPRTPPPAPSETEVIMLPPARSVEPIQSTPQQTPITPAGSPFFRQTSTDILDPVLWEEKMAEQMAQVEALRVSCKGKQYCDNTFFGQSVLPPFVPNTWLNVPNQTRRSENSDWRIFNPSGPNPAEIRQGDLGDCWFLSAVAVVAYRRPDLIADLFLTKTVTKEAVFGVRFWNSGVWTTVVVDGMFPIKYKQFRFGSCSDESVLWVAILEKAYAKMHGSYTAISSGLCDEAFYNLTGAPCVRYELKAANVDDVMWANLVSFSTSGCVVGATSKDTESLGINARHCYSFLQAFTIENGDRIVELRDPWGQTEWRGQYNRRTPGFERFIKS
eukprot:PhF_6_TR10431/c1_g1_i4/m.16462/K08582/CAPN15; calpain-15